MINNTEDIKKLKEENKIYLPEEEIDQNYTYRTNGNIIEIIRPNCNNNICNCKIYFIENNILSNLTTCDINEKLYELSNNTITNDVNDSKFLRNNWIQEKGIIFLIIILGVLIAKWLTKERKHV